MFRKMNPGELLYTGKIYIIADLDSMSHIPMIPHYIRDGVVHYSGCLPHGNPFPVFRAPVAEWKSKIICVADDVTRETQETSHRVAEMLNATLKERTGQMIAEHVTIESWKFFRG